jgi:hypothetical protein
MRHGVGKLVLGINLLTVVVHFLCGFVFCLLWRGLFDASLVSAKRPQVELGCSVRGRIGRSNLKYCLLGEGNVI